MVATDTRLAPPAEERRGRSGGSGLRTDIEGLRALAIGMVLVYHAGIVILPGGFIGVDVFFVVSGFLITGLLVREVERTGRVSLRRFYARRARRLLPAAAVVLVVTAILTWLTASVVEWRTVGGDIVAAAAYVINWRLADRSVDYLAEGIGASPVQHFWSLAVEEQFYIVWPLLLLIVAALIRARRWPVKPMMVVALTLIAVPSLIWSIIASSASPESAFFVSTTRIWELAIGAFVAIGAGLWCRVPRQVALALGWAGIVTIIAAGFLLNSSIAWPSAWVLIPTLATAAVIIAGSSSHGGVSVLSWRPFVWIGGLSYSLYLWHWPLLIAAQNVWGDLGQKRGLLVMALAFIPAWLSLRFLENPVRYSPRVARSNGLALSLGVNLSAVAAIAGLVLVSLTASTTAATSTGDPKLGARSLALDDGVVAEVEVQENAESVVPAPQDAPGDVPSAYARDCQVPEDRSEPTYCDYGDPGGATSVVLAGDSKALQWVTVLDRIAKAEGWSLRTATKSGCPFSGATPGLSNQPYESCVSHSEAVLDDLLADPPDVVLTSHRASSAFDASGRATEAALVDGLVEYWTALEEAGTDVIVLLDNPNPSGAEGETAPVYECVAENLTDLERCAFPLEAGRALSGQPAQLLAAEALPDVDVVDLSDTLCTDDVRPAVINDVLVYRQGSHVTNTYALSLEEILQDRLGTLIPRAR